TRILAAVLVAPVALLAGGTAILASCGPFTDVTDGIFCPFVLEIFYLGITTGTNATTYDPASPVSRLQMATFLSRTVDSVRKRGSRRASLGQFSAPQGIGALAITTLGGSPRIPRSDGADVWVPTFSSATVARVRASDGKILETWSGAPSAFAALSAMGLVFATGFTTPGTPGSLYRIDPAQPAGAVTTVATNLADGPLGIAFDGSRIWVATAFGGLSIVTPGATLPWTVTTVTTGFSQLNGALFDGGSVWVTDNNAKRLFKLDGSGGILQTVTVGN